MSSLCCGLWGPIPFLQDLQPWLRPHGKGSIRCACIVSCAAIDPDFYSGTGALLRSAVAFGFAALDLCLASWFLLSLVYQAVAGVLDWDFCGGISILDFGAAITEFGSG